MSDKAAKKKQFILDTAKTIFANKGYKDVTMKDIVEACEISRGGLYLYFDSTEAIFEEILSGEASDSVLDHPMDESSAGDIIAMFLNEQKKAILHPESSLEVALYEYLFYKHSAGKPAGSVITKREKTIEALASIIEKGAESGELYSEDPGETARNIMFIIDGLKISAKTVGITESDVDGQLLYILSGLIAEE